MIRSVRELLRSKARFFLLATLAALALRLFLVWRFPAVVDDSRLYADIARNWLQHGKYGVTDSGQVVPTLSRLPGYPAFLAIIFATISSDSCWSAGSDRSDFASRPVDFAQSAHYAPL